MKKLKALYNVEISEKKALKQELDKTKEALASAERNIHHLRIYNQDCEK